MAQAKKSAGSRIMAGFGKKGNSALQAKLGPEGFSAHMKKLAKKRWKKARAEAAANAPINRRRGG